MSKSYELTGFVPTIKKPDRYESLIVARAQLMDPNRVITCVFNAGQENEFTRTRIPYFHALHQMVEELEINLINDMQQADFIQLIDTSDR